MTVPGQNVGRKQLGRQRKREREGGVRGLPAHVPRPDQVNISLISTHLFPQASTRVTIPIGLHRLEETRASVWPLIWRRVVEVPSMELLTGSQIL